MSIEVSSEPDTRRWLWECFECGEQRGDYRTLLAAERDADTHSCHPSDRDAA